MGTIDNLRALFSRGFINPSSSDFSIEKLPDGRHRVEVSPQGNANLLAQALQGGAGGKPGGGRGGPGGTGACAGAPHMPSHVDFTATGTTFAGGSFTCGSSASAHVNRVLTFSDPDNCQELDDVFPEITYNCTAPSCSCTMPAGGATEFLYGLLWNSVQWELNLRGAMASANPVLCACSGNANGSIVQPATIILGNNPIGTHTVNFDDGVSFFNFTVIFS